MTNQQYLKDRGYVRTKKCSCGPKGPQEHWAKAGKRYPKVHLYLRIEMFKIWHREGKTEEGPLAEFQSTGIS